MALFTDGPAPTIDDLVEEDSGLLDLAENTGINITSKLRLAHEEIASDLELWLNRRSAIGVLWTPAAGVGQIVITPSLKRWETMHALAMVYRDAYFSALVDRYQAKWQEYKQLARNARESVVASGLALVSDPVRRPEPPALGTAPGPYSGGTYYVSVAGVNAGGQEGEPSWASSITTTEGNSILVVPGVWATGTATFRVYAGRALDTMIRQNSVDLPAGLTFTYLPGEVTEGPLPGGGQVAEYVRPLTRTIQRG